MDGPERLGGTGGTESRFPARRRRVRGQNHVGAAARDTITGLDQLTPTAGCSLYLVSLRFVDAGSGGETLAQTVDRILTSGDAVPGTRAAILSKLADLGYHLADSAHYSRRRRIADAARLILIEDGCPRLTPAAMAALPSGFAANLIQDVRYRVDVEALGYSDGTEPFLAVLPA